MDTNKNFGAFASASDAAEWAGVSLPTLMAWLQRKDFPAFKSGKRWIIPRQAFEAWLSKRAEERAEL